MSELIRINKYIASSTKYSRRDVDSMIEAGRVKLNDELVTEQGVKVDITKDVILIDDIPMVEEDITVIKFYKPRSILTAYGDGFGKDTLESIPFFKEKKLPYSGRLDYESEGLLIFSNDGELIQRLQRPEHKIEKEYIVTVDRKLTDEEANEFIGGLETSDEKYLPCKLRSVGKRQYSVTITQGKKRQIREMFKYFGVTVKKLVRIRIGGINLDDMRAGEIRQLNKFEMKSIKAMVKKINSSQIIYLYKNLKY